MDYVVDTSILIQGFIADVNSARVKTLLRSAYDRPPVILHIVDFGLVECTNILWKRVAFHALPLVDAQKALRSLHQAPLMVHPAVLHLNRALEIASQYHLPIYDSVYLALTESLQHALLSDDVKQIGIATQMKLSIKMISDFTEYQPL